ncbi:hypothetical protein [Siphonobacter curvatus]|uniref:Uncharacterized protein n=1 Tax=Siphonobacter curvatus TaxID=2094562 RepID=A0A2S7IIT3_9BACT|nr:hypothetical protein [Siphonobacter curvatus]PQA56087.1 hypothetical protein C5O19_17155 [Siphonobacter curvatus]
MKTRFLFPHWAKALGWGLTFCFLILGIIYMFRETYFPNLEKSVDWLTIHIPQKLTWDAELLGNTQNNLLDEIITVGLTLGLVLVAFSKERKEDEWVAQVRLESLQWGVMINALLIILATLLVYNGAYLSILIYNVFTALAFFVIRFNWILYIKPLLFRRNMMPLV